MAAAQRGMIHRSQLRAARIGPGAIAHRLSKGTLHRVMASVYTVGHPGLEPLALEVAALLHARRDAVLSHASAGALWGFAQPASRVCVTVWGRNVRQPANVRIHRVDHLDRRDLRLLQGLPVTAPARTVIDLAGSSCTDARLERALAEARVLRLVTDRDLLAALDRCPGRTGVARMRRLLETEHEQALTRSEAERALLRLVTDAQLPRPNINVTVCGYEVDALWPQARLILEVDGHAFHGHRAAFERDRRRDQVLAAAGYRVIRVTWRQLIGEPLAVAVRLGLALAHESRA